MQNCPTRAVAGGRHPGRHVEGLYGCLDYYREVNDPFSIELLNRYERLYPGSAMFTAGSACTGMYRALKLWEAAVNEAGTLNQEHVIAALDHTESRRVREAPPRWFRVGTTCG